MNQSGGLRKRRRRNLAKVNGLTRIPYNEASDTYTGLDDIENGPTQEMADNMLWSRSSEHITLRLSSKELAEYRRSGDRVTRDPNCQIEFDVEGNNNEGVMYIAEDIITNNHLNPVVAENRTFLISNSTMLLLKALVYLGTIFGTVPWKWNKQKYRIENRSDRFVKCWQWYLCFSTVQTISIFYLQLHAFLEKLYSEDSSNREAFMSSMALLWSGGVLGKNINMYMNGEKTRVYLNALLDFNRVHVQKYVIQLDDYQEGGTLLINKFFFITDLAQLPISASLFVRMPFQPWYFFSFIYPKPWYWLIPGAIHEMMLIGQALTFLLLVPWTIVAHANTLQFWLREAHNNFESDYTIEDLRAPRNALRTYKSMQVLNGLFNECMAPIAIPIVKVIWAATIVTCGYILLRSMNHLFIDEFPGILSFPSAIIAVCIKTSVIMTMSAEVSDLGRSCLDSWSLTKQKNFRRILMSCPGFQIWSARFYFITVSATITYFMQVFGFITDCVITFP